MLIDFTQCHHEVLMWNHSEKRKCSRTCILNLLYLIADILSLSLRLNIWPRQPKFALDFIHIIDIALLLQKPFLVLRLFTCICFKYFKCMLLDCGWLISVNANKNYNNTALHLSDHLKMLCEICSLYHLRVSVRKHLRVWALVFEF